MIILCMCIYMDILTDQHHIVQVTACIIVYNYLYIRILVPLCCIYSGWDTLVMNLSISWIPKDHGMRTCDFGTGMPNHSKASVQTVNRYDLCDVRVFQDDLIRCPSPPSRNHASADTLVFRLGAACLEPSRRGERSFKVSVYEMFPAAYMPITQTITIYNKH